MTWTTEFNTEHAAALIADVWPNPTELESDVIAWILDSADGYADTAWESLRGVLSDLAYGGCASGMVGHLIYYADTSRYYERHRCDIGAIVAELVDSSGAPIDQLINPDYWDKSDPMASEPHNQCALCWLAFEEVAYRIASALDMEL